MPKTLLFLCTGNYYRSRFAEIFFNALASRERLDWRAVSRGLRTDLAGPGAISEFTERRLTELGVDCGAYRHMPVQCLECDLENADLVIALKEAEHRMMLRELFAAWENQVTYWHVHDIDAADPAVALAEIESLIEQLVTELAANDGPA